MHKFIKTGTIALLLLSGCGIIPLQTADTSGSGTEITNGIMGKVVYPDGTPAEGALVRARKTDYQIDAFQTGVPISPPGGESTSDRDGLFRIDSIDTGTYSIEVNDRQSNAVLLTCAVTTSASEVTIPRDTLRPTGAIRGAVAPDFDNPGPVFVMVHGLERVARIDPSSGSYSLPDMPSGSYTVSVVAAALPGAPKVIGGVSVAVGNTTTLDTVPLAVGGGWIFSKNIVLNTTASGADVAGTVTNFPLLVRLDASNFTFNQAKVDGADLRFCTSDGTSLPYEIERWNVFTKRAEVWVKIDTVLGNNSTQSITMRWGNAAATAASKGAAVFDSASGFQGVWHLADDAESSTVIDATGKNNGILKSGTAKINTSSISSPGVVGKSAELEGPEFQHWIDLGTNRAFINNKRELTVSTWIFADINTYQSGDLLSFSKGTTIDPLSSASRVSLTANSSSFLLSARPGDEGGTYLTLHGLQPYPLRTWQHVVGVVNVAADSMYIYVNGRLWNAQAAPFVEQATGTENSLRSALGSNDVGMDRFFIGKIDEARIEGVARTPAWIRLNYENLKEGGKLIK